MTCTTVTNLYFIFFGILGKDAGQTATAVCTGCPVQVNQQKNRDEIFVKTLKIAKIMHKSRCNDVISADDIEIDDLIKIEIKPILKQLM